jgi:hypothetical protein
MVAAMAAAMAGRAESRGPQMDARLTVFTYDRAGVPRAVMGRAKGVAAEAFAAAGIQVRWVEGKRIGEPWGAPGEVLTVVFDGPVPASFRPQAMAFANVGGGADADVHVFYHRVADFADTFAHLSVGTHVSMPEFLGNVLAHELTHALEGVKRHSREGLMKAEWNAGDIAGMVYGPLPLAAEDLELLRAHFKREMSPAPTLVAAR